MNCIECGQDMTSEKLKRTSFRSPSFYRYTCTCGFTTCSSGTPSQQLRLNDLPDSVVIKENKD